MAFQGTGQGASVACTYDTNAGQFTNILWFYNADFDADDLQALATEVKTSLVDNLVDHLGVGTSLVNVTATDERTANGPIRIGNYTNGTGDATGETLPLNNAMVITLRTDFRGRSFRGRIYQGGFVEGHIDEGGFNSTIISNIVAAYNDLRSDVSGIGWTWGVRSGWENGVLRPFAIITAITALEVRSPIPGSQRRRLRRP